MLLKTDREDMILDLNKEIDLARFDAKVSAVRERRSVVSIEEKRNRTYRQNNYLHLILGVVAMESGEDSLKYVKEEYFKKMVNPDIFCIEKDDKYLGKVRRTLSSAEITAEQMSVAIDRFKRWAASEGIYLPDPEDGARLREIEMELDRMKSYIRQ